MYCDNGSLKLALKEFELDATESGQDTLNTLYLAVLNWGMNKRRPLVLTDLAAGKNEPVYTSDQSVPLV